MKAKILIFIAAIFLLYSCQKELSIESGTPNPTPVPVIKDSLTVRSIKQTQFGTGDPDSSQIDYFYLDTNLNKIKDVLKFSGDNFTDSIVRIYTYNADKQLISVEEQASPLVDFIRDVSGKLITAKTYYQGAIVPNSTGSFTYGTQGLNTTITFLDSSLKFPFVSTGIARSFYKVSFSPGNVLRSYENYSINTVQQYSKETYAYDNNNNLTAIVLKDTLGVVLDSTAYIPDLNKATALLTFFNRLKGDLFWFYQPDWFNIIDYSDALDYPVILSAPKKITTSIFGAGRNFSNTYNSKGNLIIAVESDDSGQIISRTEIVYN